ncbi:unnamed protein product [Trypanosoma congolense IL3000]|uniref:WGS project CAEQ00000000 data, annotated contig 1012 n=1 Tax=Trypanosoma congolense (strain IL3000) TaxID=1068625 RepID=F9W373_TRYCI|nr:unnamed protein product [Trypanosoma congolense IL3000]
MRLDLFCAILLLATNWEDPRIFRLAGGCPDLLTTADTLEDEYHYDTHDEQEDQPTSCPSNGTNLQEAEAKDEEGGIMPLEEEGVASADMFSVSAELEPIPDVSYTGAEKCGIQEVDQCTAEFCACIRSQEFGKAERVETDSNISKVTCGNEHVSNCYQLHHCARRKMACIWAKAQAYEDAVKGVEWNSTALPDNWKMNNATNGTLCRSLLDISRNLTSVPSEVSFYNTPFYADCATYMMYTFKRSGGYMCVADSVSMYVCGPSFMSTPPPRHISYVPVRNGTQRLVITITAHYVGEFRKVFQESKRGETIGIGDGMQKAFADELYKCFREGLGIGGDFSMVRGGSSLVVTYDIGFGEADTWVGDLVKENAFNLMIRPTTWMAGAQEQLSKIGEPTVLVPPIVRFTVNVDTSSNHILPELCDTSCVVALSFSTVVTAIVYALAGFAFCGRKASAPTCADSGSDVDSEVMEATACVA